MTTFSLGRDQPEEQDEVTSGAFYDLRTFFQEEGSPVVIPKIQVTSDDQVENMPVLVTSTPRPEEQMQELQ